MKKLGLGALALFVAVVSAVTLRNGSLQSAARKLGIRLWILLRDQIEYEEFCRRGKLRQNGEAHAGMPDFNSGPATAVTG